MGNQQRTLCTAAACTLQNVGYEAQLGDWGLKHLVLTV